MTTNTSELIAKIRVWEAADKACYAFRDKQDNEGLSQEEMVQWRHAREGREIAEYSVKGDRVFPLAAFVALADHCERLEAERAATNTRIARIGDKLCGLHQMTMTIEWTLDVIEEQLQEYKTLTGDDSASK